MKFTIKRVFKDIAFIILLSIVLVIPLIAFKTGQNIKLLPFGYVCNGDGMDIERLCNELDASGFIRIDSKEHLEDELKAAHIDCGIVFDDNFTGRLEDSSMSQSITLITSSETVADELCRIQVVSAVSVIYSPYVTYDSLDKEIDLHTVKETYYNMYDTGRLFTFDITTENGAYSASQSRSLNLFRGALSILIFITVFIGICRPACRHKQDIRPRLGGFRSFTHIMLPEVFVRSAALILVAMLCSLLMCIIGLGSISGNGMLLSLCKTIVLYVLICDLAGVVLTLILPDAAIIVLTVFVTILSLGLCPIFTDLSEMIPAAETIRNYLLPYLMWVL